MRRPNELSARQAARVLEVDRKTTVAWAQRAISGDPSPLEHARRNAAGRYFLRESEVRALAAADHSEKF